MIIISISIFNYNLKLLAGVCTSPHLNPDLNPCVRARHYLLRDVRGLFSAGSPTDRSNPKCMRRIRETWYRVISPAGSGTGNADMMTKCVEPLHCGTVYPIWIKG